jgi:cobalt-zinc-cadmium efflux system outer membrane protein
LQIEHAWHNYEASRNNVLRFKEIISSKSTELKNLTFEAYQLGEIDLLNLLNAQQIYLDTRKSYLTALRYYLQIIKLEKYMNTEIVY